MSEQQLELPLHFDEIQAGFSAGVASDHKHSREPEKHAANDLVVIPLRDYEERIMAFAHSEEGTNVHRFCLEEWLGDLSEYECITAERCNPNLR